MKIQDLMCAMEEVAPLRLAEPWDNVGLLAGDPSAPLRRALLTIDYTAAVAAEAQTRGCDAVIAYHPPIFDPLKRLHAGHLVYDAIRHGIALYSPHTALDLADGGTNDVLADVLGLQDRRPLAQRKEPAAPWHYRLVTFVPPEHLDRLAAALFDAGAGRLGNYSRCSYRSDGIGTFFPGEGAAPAVGQVGKLETTREIRLETLVPAPRLDAVVSALREAHPYEEPAFDLIQLSTPQVSLGLGRIGQLAAVSRQELLQRIRDGLRLSRLLVAGPTDGEITIAACAAGSCGKLYLDAIRHNAGLYLTGELKHHDALAAAAAGLTVVCVLHSNSERAMLHRLSQHLKERLPGVDLHLSTADRDPFIVL